MKSVNDYSRSDLHKNGIAHGELYPAKILIDPDFHPHLGDFSFIIPPRTTPTHSDFDESFLPPEAQKRSYRYTIKQDVYTFGGTIFQMITLHEPFEDTEYTNPLYQATALGRVDQRFQDEILPEDKPLYEIVQTYCWKFNPEERIDMDTLGNWLFQGAQLNVKDENELQNIIEYLKSFEIQKYPNEYIQGTDEQIQKAVKNGFYGVEQSRSTFFQTDGIMTFLSKHGIIQPTSVEEDVKRFLAEFTV